MTFRKENWRWLLAGLTITLGLSAQGAVLQIDLQGKAGSGLLSTNENSIINGGLFVGGEVGSGIYYDDVTKTLTLNFSWAPGAGPGFTGLSGNATAAHIHGPTPTGGAVGFLENAGAIINLGSGPWSPSALGGGFFGGTFLLSPSQETDLLAGKYYVNVHTVLNPAGEIRGQLVVVPEASSALLGLAGCGLLLRRRR